MEKAKGAVAIYKTKMTCFGGVMNNTHRNSWMRYANSDYSKKNDKKVIASGLVDCKACESMRFGYEQMAHINLDMCDGGCADFQNAIVIFENVLNGDDTERDY